ncbi:MAG: hypothetical protein NZM43_11225 [Saprospiraceae bacterium]|nr:hypothetical protein [Saprospiraceae bacterium]MDW8484879.1 hypothetical protein [Saprospiraceae bacterium]
MYTSFIGKKFLALWNERMGKNLTAREFFDEVMFPVFFNDERHFLHVHNSPFFQRPSKKDMETGLPEAEVRRLKLHERIETDVPHGGIYVGYAAREITETTSGQLTNMPTKPSSEDSSEMLLSPLTAKFSPMPVSKEEMYASWIGQGLAVGIIGGLCWLFSEAELLWKAFEGWKVYRKTLEQTPHLKGCQIETWNGQWLAHRLNGGDENDFKIEPERKVNPKTGEVYWAIPTIQWTKLLLTLCRNFPNRVMTVYAYNLSQTNTTLGFINFYLPEVYRMYELRDQLFVDRKQAGLTNEEIEALEPYFSFSTACQRLGAIGLRAIEPDSLRDYIPKKDDKCKNFNLSKKEDYNRFNLYKLWICAMINRKEVLDLAKDLAEILLQFEQAGGDRGKTKDERLSEQVRTSTNLRVFADRLSEVVEQAARIPDFSKEKLTKIRSVVHEAVGMPTDHFPLFIALLRFEYAYYKAFSN